jgi:hypothetical protein
MGQREDIIAKVQKLSNMTLENGASEAEALLAAKLAAKLIQDFDLTRSDLELKTDSKGCLARTLSTDMELYHWAVANQAIAKLYGTRYFRKIGRENFGDMDLSFETMDISFYGFPLDAEASFSLCRVIYLNCVRELNTWLKAKSFRGANRKEQAKGFQVAYGSRLVERITDLIPPPPPSQGRGLIVLKAQLVNDEWLRFATAHGVQERKGTSGMSISPGTINAGTAAANRVVLNKSVSGGPKRLG